MTAWSEECLHRLTRLVSDAADAERAVAMRTYMRNQFAFAGIPTPERVQLGRAALTGLAEPTEADLVAFTDAAWDREQREYQYFACWLLKHRPRTLTSASLPAAERWITTKS